MPDTDRLWVFIHFPRLALEARFPDPAPARSAAPALLTAPDGRHVFACNTAAEVAGIRPGMALRTAYCLVEAVELAEYDPELEAGQLRRLALLSYRLCAGVRLCSPAGLCLEAGSMLRLHGGLAPWLDELDATLGQSGHRYHLAVGHTPLAARLLAENGRDGRLDDPEAEWQRLEELGVERLALPLEARDVRALTAMGLKTLGELYRAPRADLGYRFGQGLVDHLAALTRPRELGEIFRLPPRFNERLELWHEVTTAERLIFPLRRLLQSLAAYLGARQLSVDEVVLRLEHRDRAPTRLSVQAPGGARRVEQWQTLVALALERLDLPEAVIGLRLAARRFVGAPGEAGDLLGDARPEADADQLLTLLIAKLGRGAVARPAAGPDRRPLQASQPRPVSALMPTARPRAQPALLLEAPCPVDPAAYRLLAGPERLALPVWVQPGGFQRDYFRAWHEAGRQHHWLSRHPDGRWYLEGLFA